jgi:nucleotide-binding universal stress UspA family protein
MYNRILVAVDGSETSNLALKEAIKLAKDQHAALRFVHVVDVSLIYIDLGAPYVLEYQKALQATGQRVIDDCSAIVRDAGIEFDTTSIVVDMIGQHVYDAIEEEAKRWQADLIVIGTHGRRGIRRFLLGSIAEGVARVTSKPVLLIRGG